MNVVGANIITKLSWLRDLAQLGILFMGLLPWTPASAGTEESESPAAVTISSERIADAFVRTCDGYSSDELLIRDDLRAKFLQILASETNHATTATLSRQTERETLLRLLQIRKSGKLGARATRRGRKVDETIFPVAEIAARVVSDRHRITSDTMFADPQFRAELQSEAELIQPGVDPYSVRKAVLALRKRRSLRPELVLKVADWDRTISTFSMPTMKTAIATGTLPTNPGVYLFRNVQGYLYIGEASNLSKRLTTHLRGSDRKSLANVLDGVNGDDVTIELHVFPKDSPARKVTVRRAYESELIRSREPKFNVRP